MKVILEDFDYKGSHFDKYEVDFPDLEASGVSLEEDNNGNN